MRPLFDAIFGCSHRRTTFPQAPLGKYGSGERVTCLDCGREFRYDWGEMRLAGRLEQPEPRAAVREARETV